MFGLGFPELILILVVALLIFGPKKVPDLARSLGRGIREFRSAMSEMERSIRDQLPDENDIDFGQNNISADGKENLPTPSPGEKEEKKPGDEKKNGEGKVV